MLTGTVAPGSRLTAAELAREPRHQHVVAWFDGHAAGAGQGSRHAFPRRLTSSEAAAWREGWREGWRERTCHAAHGFAPCQGRPHTGEDPT